TLTTRIESSPLATNWNGEAMIRPAPVGIGVAPKNCSFATRAALPIGYRCRTRAAELVPRAPISPARAASASADVRPSDPSPAAVLELAPPWRAPPPPPSDVG